MAVRLSGDILWCEKCAKFKASHTFQICDESVICLYIANYIVDELTVDFLSEQYFADMFAAV